MVTVPELPGLEPKRSPVVAILVVLAVIAAGAFAIFNRHRTEPVVPKAKPVAAAVVPITRGRVAINAFPWGEITAVRNTETGESIDIGPNLVTPAPLDLAPGRYEITLRNPQFPTAITKTVDVSSDRDATLEVQFRDPASAPLPDFGASR
jgi:hypothetical protein